ncbi:hypothetical protein BDB01DRAFT_799867 [Pilobolus umbonatus]|nr:hypothetical protein BDB01DRAFT_799867 [Pilobolus umbonatus]
MATPQRLISNSVNPANLVELETLTKVIDRLQQQNDIKGSIPYLAKIVQILDNQTIQRPPKEDKARLPHYYQQINELHKVQANAHFQLAEAQYQVYDFIACESSLTLSVKLWEKLLHYNPGYQSELRPLLIKSYETLKLCYDAMGKSQLAMYMDTRKNKLLPT